MNSSTNDFRVSPMYNGPRRIEVPVKMYSKNTLLNAFGVQSRRWLGINLDRFTLSFHKSKTGLDPRNELFFWQIKSVDADMSRSQDNRYYLNIQTLDKVYNFKFQNVQDFYVVVEALRHTLRNNQPFYVSREDYSKLAQLQRQSGINNQSYIRSSNFADEISSEEEFETNRFNQRIISSPGPYTQSTRKEEVKRTVTPVQVTVPMSPQAPQRVIPTMVSSQIFQEQAAPQPMVPEEYQYQKWKQMDQFQGQRSTMETRKSFDRAFEVPTMRSPLIPPRVSTVPTSPPIIVQTKSSMVEERAASPGPQIIPGSPILGGSQIIPPFSPPIISRSIRQSDDKISTHVTTTVNPPPALSPDHNLTKTDFDNFDIMLAQEERSLLSKQEELRQKENILRLQKLNIKRAEIEARKESLFEKEIELSNVEQEIKLIQTEIGSIKNRAIMDKINFNDHRELVAKSRCLISAPVLSQIPGEIVEVSVKETKTLNEDFIAPRWEGTYQTRNSNTVFQTSYNRY